MCLSSYDLLVYFVDPVSVYRKKEFHLVFCARGTSVTKDWYAGLFSTYVQNRNYKTIWNIKKSYVLLLYNPLYCYLKIKWFNKDPGGSDSPGTLYRVTYDMCHPNQCGLPGSRGGSKISPMIFKTSSKQGASLL